MVYKTSVRVEDARRANFQGYRERALLILGAKGSIFGHLTSCMSAVDTLPDAPMPIWDQVH